MKITLTESQINDIVAAKATELTNKCNEAIEVLKAKLSTDIEALKAKVKKEVNTELFFVQTPDKKKKKRNVNITHTWKSTEVEDIQEFRKQYSKPIEIVNAFMKRNPDVNITKSAIYSKISALRMQEIKPL